MFTGIIEEKASVENIKDTGETLVLTILATKIMSDINIGDSIAVNGVCLTVTSFSETSFTVDVMPETVKATSLRMLQKGSAVNVERAMPADGRFGGHFVSGHVDAAGSIAEIIPHENAVYVKIKVPAQYMKYLTYKGSVAVDGISLTIFGVNDAEELLTLSIIPHTWKETVLGEKNPGDSVNIECDMLSKYTERILAGVEGKENSGLTAGVLEQNGYK
ncbi:riboflavin synthase [Alteribacillus sp. HJP-4]|uniref:riboflavin synthase n=1 Tax=Alteribacillus sp. HJP-4 TaxID=2775394 RepID=UPI0035CCDD42